MTVPDSAVPHPRRAAYPARPGNQLRPLIDGEPAFRRVCEAIETARHSIWATVTFMWAGFRMPDERGTALDVLDRAAARGVDVRLIFWRPDPETESLKTNAFWGSPEQLAMLDASQPGVSIRWDRAHPGYCQHQKTWLIDAGTETETAFLGGINLNPHAMVAPGHHGDDQMHDLYVELTGPSVVDVHHNFAQRWNEASERLAPDGRWGEGSATDLPFPDRVPAPCGDATVQIQRTIHAGRYTSTVPAPDGMAFDSAAGERSNLDFHRDAIDAAQRSIYIENQYITVPEIVDRLRAALERGVEVVAVLPPLDEPGSELATLGEWGNFTLAGIAGPGTDGTRAPVWIHAKLMIVDGGMGTVGSCNLHRHSLFGNSELNAAFWDPATASALLRELLREHLDADIAGMDDVAALRLFRAIARENRARRDRGARDWRGIAWDQLPIRPRRD